MHRGEDGRTRCFWCGDDPAYQHYHDHEWGYPVADDKRLFEKLCLESFQSGLSWRTILMKRENFRRAFAGFDYSVLATWGEAEVQRLLGDAGIVRHRGKIEATLNNARCAEKLVAEHGSLAAFVWRFEPIAEVEPSLSITKTVESVALSKALKAEGWKFFGPTTAYAFMQSMGLVNDHALGCSDRDSVAQARQQFQRPR